MWVLCLAGFIDGLLIFPIVMYQSQTATLSSLDDFVSIGSLIFVENWKTQFSILKTQFDFLD